MTGLARLASPGPHQAPPSASTEVQGNAISPSDMSRMQEEAELYSRHAELKDRLRGISQGYDRLRKVSHQGYSAEAGELGTGLAPRTSPQCRLLSLPFSLEVTCCSLHVRRGLLVVTCGNRPLPS